MKTFLKLSALLLLTNLSFSQDKACDFEINVATDTSSTRVLKDKIIDESLFGNTTSFLTFKLFDVDGVLGLNFQYLQKSKDFLTPICIDKNTKMYLELSNGKQVKLINSTDIESCNDLQYDDVNKNNLRILSGFFYFTPENFQDLKTEKVYLIKITANTGDVNFVIKPELNSEIYKGKSTPDTYFMDYLKCFGVFSNTNVKTIAKTNDETSNDKTLPSDSGNAVGNGGEKSSNEPYILDGRKLKDMPIPNNNCMEQGVVVMQIIVDRNGNVLEANLDKGTTNSSDCLVKSAREAALKTKWKKDKNALEKQSGKITYTFKINK